LTLPHTPATNFAIRKSQANNPTVSSLYTSKTNCKRKMVTSQEIRSFTKYISSFSQEGKFFSVQSYHIKVVKVPGVTFLQLMFLKIKKMIGQNCSETHPTVSTREK
jgi:hypothetical protein